MNTNNAANGEAAGRGRVLRPPRAAETEWQQNRIFYVKKNYIIFCTQEEVKLLRKMKGTSINNCDFFKFVISVVRGGLCWFSPGVKKTPSYATDCMSIYTATDGYLNVS